MAGFDAPGDTRATYVQVVHGRLTLAGRFGGGLGLIDDADADNILFAEPLRDREPSHPVVLAKVLETVKIELAAVQDRQSQEEAAEYREKDLPPFWRRRVFVSEAEILDAFEKACAALSKKNVRP